MKIEADTVDQYIAKCPAERQSVLKKLRKVITDNLPSGFHECINYGMIGYVVPHSLFPSGYHCDPALPLPFMNVASQKNFVAVYHMGIYADPKLMKWFTSEYPKHCTRKLEMGKSCIRFKKMDEVPYELIGKLAGKMSPADWIKLYEKQLKK
jgi:uncharacterized protein YdhG (YjbR/CyaY superfamily)